jgi:hypothetical protein
VKTKMLITASFVAVATMIAANAKAGPNNVDVHSPRAADDGQVFGPREVYVMVPHSADDLPIHTAAAGPAGSPTRGPSDVHSPRAADDGQVFGPREVYVMVPHS